MQTFSAARSTVCPPSLPPPPLPSPLSLGLEGALSRSGAGGAFHVVRRRHRIPSGEKPQRPRFLCNWDDVTAGWPGVRGGAGAPGEQARETLRAAPNHAPLPQRRVVRQRLARIHQVRMQRVPRRGPRAGAAVWGAGRPAVTWPASACASEVSGDAPATSPRSLGPTKRRRRPFSWQPAGRFAGGRRDPRTWLASGGGALQRRPHPLTSGGPGA